LGSEAREQVLVHLELHMIQERCDVGILPGKIPDESLVACLAGVIALHLAASTLVKSCPE
jgi:hypothetical protein